jgi:hypothetical protein
MLPLLTLSAFAFITPPPIIDYFRFSCHLPPLSPLMITPCLFHFISTLPDATITLLLYAVTPLR